MATSPEFPHTARRPAWLHADIHRVAVVRALQCDLAIQLHGSGGLSNPVVQDFGARLTTGFTGQPQRDC
ncbi:MAG: hypothetical protein NBV65_13420, partial [Burkholderiaceae bacterium]|nr:hypothetical protein [Burkholderiaceae bacterium]